MTGIPDISQTALVYCTPDSAQDAERREGGKPLNYLRMISGRPGTGQSILVNERLLLNICNHFKARFGALNGQIHPLTLQPSLPQDFSFPDFQPPLTT